MHLHPLLNLCLSNNLIRILLCLTNVLLLHYHNILAFLLFFSPCSSFTIFYLPPCIVVPHVPPTRVRKSAITMLMLSSLLRTQHRYLNVTQQRALYCSSWPLPNRTVLWSIWPSPFLQLICSVSVQNPCMPSCIVQCHPSLDHLMSPQTN